MYQRRRGKGRTRNPKRRKNPRKRRLSKKRQNRIRKPGSRWLFLARSAQKKNTDEIILPVRGHPGYWDKQSLDKRVNKGLPFTMIYWQFFPLFSFLVFLPFLLLCPGTVPEYSTRWARMWTHLFSSVQARIQARSTLYSGTKVGTGSLCAHSFC